MKVTIDSSESLEDALRVVGALYDVTLTVAPETSASSVAPATGSRTAKRRKAAGRSTAKKAAASTRAARKTSRRRGSVSTAHVRAWARENGHEVSDRGPIAASVTEAYQAAK